MAGNCGNADSRVGGRVRAARLQRNLTPERVASFLNISHTDYIKLEEGLQRFVPIQLIGLSEILDVNVSIFFK
jgi:transcriptional regulator with XRE-family HTH domain